MQNTTVLIGWRHPQRIVLRRIDALFKDEECAVRKSAVIMLSMFRNPEGSTVTRTERRSRLQLPFVPLASICGGIKIKYLETDRPTGRQAGRQTDRDNNNGPESEETTEN